MNISVESKIYIVSSSGVALPSDAGAGDLLCSFSLFSVGVVGAAVVDGMGGIGTGGGGMTGGGMNGTAGFSTMQRQTSKTE